MLYLLNICKERGEEIELYETHTESVIVLGRDKVGTFINATGLKIANAKIDGDKIITKDWYYDMNYRDREEKFGYPFIMLGKINSNCYKVVDCEGTAHYLSRQELKKQCWEESIANCRATTKWGEELEHLDTADLSNAYGFEDHIKSEYTKYELKSKLIGLNNSFEYKIEKNKVIVTKYTGAGKRVVLPNFVTSIAYKAFWGKGITDITLNEGLKHIGESAFSINKLTEIQIPETVEFICRSAFFGNNRLYTTDMVGRPVLNSKKVRVMSNKTIVMSYLDT